MGEAVERQDASFWEVTEGRIVPHKNLLYLWQLLNYLVIGRAGHWEQVSDMIGCSLAASIRYEQYQPHNCMKNALICVFNYIKQASKHT